MKFVISRKVGANAEKKMRTPILRPQSMIKIFGGKEKLIESSVMSYFNGAVFCGSPRVSKGVMHNVSFTPLLTRGPPLFLGATKRGIELGPLPKAVTDRG